MIRKLCSKETTQEIDNIGVAFVGVGSEKAAGLKPVFVFVHRLKEAERVKLAPACNLFVGSTCANCLLTDC